jgi:hypothetical protein
MIEYHRQPHSVTRNSKTDVYQLVARVAMLMFLKGNRRTAKRRVNLGPPVGSLYQRMKKAALWEENGAALIPQDSKRPEGLLNERW